MSEEQSKPIIIEGFNGIGDPGSFGYEPWG